MRRLTRQRLRGCVVVAAWAAIAGERVAFADPPSAAASAEGEPLDLAGPSAPRESFRVGAALGVAMNVTTQLNSQYAVVLHGALPISEHGSLVTSPSIHVGSSDFALLVPLGYEHRFPVGPPNLGLAIFARASAGYAALWEPTPVHHYLLLSPEAGVEWYFNRRFGIAVEPVDIPILLGSPGPFAWARVTVGATLRVP